MKRKLLCSALFVSMAFAGIAQKDSSRSTKRDTIRVGNILIIKKGKGSDNDSVNITLGRRSPSYPSYNRTTTNWGVFDIGFSNYTDKTDYGNTGSFLVNKPGSPNLSASDFKLRTGKSINVNIWFFMQTLHLVKNNVNIKYGFGLELNNYRYKSSISYREDGTLPYSGGLQTNAPFIFRDSIFFSKNKLAADYLTIPFMINFASNKYSINKGISVSFGVSAGYLYSQRNKQKSDERGKKRNKGDYDMERFKLSYIGELGLGPVKFYGSYSPKSMYEHSLDMRPYTIGIRFSN
ncbi:MAG TPA: hypothetical protein PLN30_05145 [Ferruginibacter sp.]|nr:hypothetical protein [Ferruginibacter sp.]